MAAAKKKPSPKPKGEPIGRGALVIVESPAKCKTIEKILGKGFSVKASMGHIIDLPKSEMAIDIANGFEPKYIVLSAKRKNLSLLKKAFQNKADLYMACDPDREGEAIAWHLMKTLAGKKRAFRVRFNEITPNAIRAAFDKPGTIDMNLIGAQQARRILDRLVGYSLSPLLWKKVAKGLSAGRVQSVALRIIVDREKEVRAFHPEEYWTLEADLAKKGSLEIFRATLEKKKNKKIEIKNETEARAISAEIRREQFVVEELKESQKRRNPQAPYTTSKLQQEAYNRLRYQPTRTMRTAQGLYEGMDLGSGETVGLITYMRTDATTVSQTAIKEVRSYIAKQMGQEYLPPEPNVFKSKKSAQAAHEAIRPTSVARTPASLRHILTQEQMDLYTLIWQKFVSSQMKPAVLEAVSVTILAGIYQFRASGSRILFDGYLKVWGNEDAETRKMLPPLQKADHLDLHNLSEEQHFTKPPPRYTDASLVKVLEEEGIGRPSTYAPIIQTIVARHYVERQGGSLIPTELGILVVNLLVEHFPELMDKRFTAGMESNLDDIEDGKRQWPDVLKEFYSGFSQRLAAANEVMKAVKKVEIQTDEICDLCQKPLVVKWGRRGRFLSCSTFPKCRFSKSISTSVECPQCGKGKLVQRKSKSGKGRAFYGCTTYPACTYIVNKLPQSAGS